MWKRGDGRVEDVERGEGGSGANVDDGEREGVEMEEGMCGREARSWER